MMYALRIEGCLPVTRSLALCSLRCDNLLAWLGAFWRTPAAADTSAWDLAPKVTSTMLKP